IVIRCDPKHGPLAWLSELGATAPERILGRVFIHLFKTLQRGSAFKLSSNNLKARAEAQDQSDLRLGHVSYHVVVKPTVACLRKCKSELERHFAPVLLVPSSARCDAVRLANRTGTTRLTIFALEEYMCHAILRQSVVHRHLVLEEWRSIIVR